MPRGAAAADAECRRPTHAAGGATLVRVAAPRPSAPASAPASTAAARYRRPRVPMVHLVGPWPREGDTEDDFEPSIRRRPGSGFRREQGRRAWSIARQVAPVLAAADDRVVYAGSGLRGYGNLIIRQSTTRTTSVPTRTIPAGEGPGAQRTEDRRMGSSDAERVLHFEIRRQGKPIDPARLLPPRRNVASPGESAWSSGAQGNMPSQRQRCSHSDPPRTGQRTLRPKKLKAAPTPAASAGGRRRIDLGNTLESYLREIRRAPAVGAGRTGDRHPRARRRLRGAPAHDRAQPAAGGPSIAKKNVGRGLPMIDLIRKATLGLMHATTKVRARARFPLQTYASWWIRQSIRQTHRRRRA